jgi:hypothetical protein
MNIEILATKNTKGTKSSCKARTKLRVSSRPFVAN